MDNGKPRPTQTIDLREYQNGGGVLQIPLNRETATKERDFLGLLIRNYLDQWEVTPHHMKEKHKDYAKAALIAFHEELTRPKELAAASNCTPVLVLENEEGKTHNSAELRFLRPPKKPLELALPIQIASYVVKNGRNSREREMLLSQLIKGNPNAEDRLMFGIAAIRANIRPDNIISFVGERGLRERIFLSRLNKDSAFHSPRLDKIDTKKLIVQTAKQSGIPEAQLNRSLTKAIFPWEVAPIIYIPFDYQQYKLFFNIRTAFIRFLGVAKGISKKEMRKGIYQRPAN